MAVPCRVVSGVKKPSAYIYDIDLRLSVSPVINNKAPFNEEASYWSNA